ncbi:RNA-binding domain-containing protein [Neocallimastix lanati (nom. inval.)]|uniref:Probable RNA-binding protein 18 n=1 Tax=Neocallimastix californiae TaxID=1754190 RepID=A0A1Y2ELS9_9FUNG|nr:RNA-binding domain-containing protein [Neocallimastix sp. JGI-2020a]ORY72511.1 RNA-binding domain-containing protein [Neocallimastix californiae]|eukprot:ORY72511.1 RNA-binding domain-containing protein [Neocallimastix californiae]
MSDNDTKNETRLYIGNFPQTITEYSLIKLFQKYGKIKNIEYLWHKFGPKRGEPRGYCFLEYEKPESAKKAIEVMNKKELLGRILTVSYIDESKKEKKELKIEKDKNVPIKKNIKTSSKIYLLEQKLKELTGEKIKSENTNNKRKYDNNSNYRNNSKNSNNKRAYNNNRSNEYNIKKRKTN